MKRTIALLGLWPVLVGLSSAQAKASPKPTLEETVSWMENFSHDHALLDGYQVKRSDSFAAKGCAATIETAFVSAKEERDTVGFFLQLINGNLPQTSSQRRICGSFVLLVSQERRQERADVVSLFPTAFRFLPNQMKFASGDGIAFQQSLRVSFARLSIRRETFIFGMLNILRQHHLESLWQYRERRRLHRMRGSIANIDVGHCRPSCWILLKRPKQCNWRTGKIHDCRRYCEIVRSGLIAVESSQCGHYVRRSNGDCLCGYRLIAFVWSFCTRAERSPRGGGNLLVASPTAISPSSSLSCSERARSKRGKEGGTDWTVWTMKSLFTLLKIGIRIIKI
jgi:hypothetical protein